MPRRTIRRLPSGPDPFSPPGSDRERRRLGQETTRAPRPRRGLPDGRAVVGGLLVATAALGTWWITVEAGRTTPTRYVVAAHPIGPGHVIETGDLRLVPMVLSPSVAAGAFTDVPSVAGSVAVGPISEGALVQTGGMAPSTGAPTGREISFAVETPWAVDGTLRTGDRIDVFATAAAGADGDTRQVLSGAVVRRLSSTGGGLGEPTGLTITVALHRSADLAGAVSALRTAELTVVRTTGMTSAEPSTRAATPATDRDEARRRSTTTTSPRSAGPGRSVTTTTVRAGAGR